MPKLLSKLLNLFVCSENKCIPLHCEARGGFGCFNSFSSEFIQQMEKNSQYVDVFYGNNKQKLVNAKELFSTIALKKFGIKFLHLRAYKNTKTWSYINSIDPTVDDIKNNAFTNHVVLSEIQQAEEINNVFKSNVDAQTTYKNYDKCSCFVIIPKLTSTFTIKVEDQVLRWIFIILQESCSTDLSIPLPNFKIDFEYLDKDMTSFFQVYHRTSVHKDIKPSNIVYCSGKYKPIDFGLSKQLPIDEKDIKRIDELQEIAGTRTYVSPYLLAFIKNDTDWLKSRKSRDRDFVNNSNDTDIDLQVDQMYLDLFESYNVRALLKLTPDIQILKSMNMWNFSDYAKILYLLKPENFFERLVLFMKKNDEYAYAITLKELEMRNQLTNLPDITKFNEYINKLCDASCGLILTKGGFFANHSGAGKYIKTNESIMIGKQKRCIYVGPYKRKYVKYLKTFITLNKAKNK